MPMPGGRPTPGRPAPVEQRASVAEQAETAEAVAVASGLNPLLVAANRLLNVLPQLRSSVQHPNPIALRDSLAQGIRQFESQARAAGVPTEKVVAARYALCTLIDETATSTPLGASGAWAQQGLLALFHGEVGGGEKFFQLMARLAENPQANQDLIELMYVCLEFGFEGRYRVTEGGQRQLEAIRQRLLMIVRKQRGDYERDLSPNWRGVSAANQRRLGSVPLWVVGAVAGLLLVAIYLGFEWPLRRTSVQPAADIAALPGSAPVARGVRGAAPGGQHRARAYPRRRPRRFRARRAERHAPRSREEPSRGNHAVRSRRRGGGRAADAPQAVKIIGSILKLIFNRWVLLGVGILALALLVRWIGPTISISNFHPYEQESVRWIQIAFIVLTPVARWGWQRIKAKRANAALTTGLLQPPAGEARPSASAEEAKQLRQRFEEALDLLKKLRFGVDRPSLWTRIRSLGSQQFLYNLPWYVFIGAPGAGKTTALVNSGLRFPLADRLGREAVRGVGGTRNCDWWFTDEAVFLDTAGRYTTQQSDRDVDAAAWKSFLELLKKSRPRRPINGVLVTASVSDLLQQSAAERDLHAQALRTRVQELYQALGLRIPVYVLVTKSDLLAGFSEFFSALGKEERAQAWGFALPYGNEGLDPASMTAELQRLERRLYDRLPERLEEERDAPRRALLYGFPQQFALLRDRLVQFVEAAFAPTKLEAKLIIRGIYFTSGTQEGSPIDRVMGALARGFGLERKLMPAQHATGKSYFLTRFLREVVFQEAGLAGFDLRWERRRQWLQTAAVAACGVVLILAALAWWASSAQNTRYLAEVGGKFGEVQQQVTLVRAGARSDLAALLPTLSGVRSLAETSATAGGSVPWSMRFGLYQGGRLEAASGAAYRRMLQDTFLPSLASYLEQYLRQDVAASQDELYEALKTYLMLYDPKHLDHEAVWRWYQTRGEQLLGSDAGPKALKAHFDALYDRGWIDPTVPRNDALIARVRTVIGSESLPNRVYGRLKREPNPDLREFTVPDKAGPKALLVFERQSRQPLTKGGPGFYTEDGYYKYFIVRVDVSTAQLAEEEAWVLGSSRGA